MDLAVIGSTPHIHTSTPPLSQLQAFHQSSGGLNHTTYFYGFMVIAADSKDPKLCHIPHGTYLSVVAVLSHRP